MRRHNLIKKMQGLLPREVIYAYKYMNIELYDWREEVEDDVGNWRLTVLTTT